VLLFPNFQRSFGLILTTNFFNWSAKVRAFIIPPKFFFTNDKYLFKTDADFELEYFKNYCFFSKADGKDNRLQVHSKLFCQYIFNYLKIINSHFTETLYCTGFYH
jgi:hypothetical protein